MYRHSSRSAPNSPPHAEAACILDVLLPDTIVTILKLLCDTPECIVAFSLSCSAAYQLCSDHALWTGLCRSITDCFPIPFRNNGWSPSAWGADSYKELYMCLLQPYRHLLQQRFWHSTTMPAGQLLVLDLEPPCIAARSVFYHTLQGTPFAHLVFLVRLPADDKGKARVHCCSCCNSSALLSWDEIYGSDVPPNPSAISPQELLDVARRRSCAASMTFTQHSAAGAAAVAGSGAALAAQHAAGNALLQGTAGKSVAAQAVAQWSPEFSLNCLSQCGALYSESYSRLQHGAPYLPPAVQAAPAGSASPQQPVSHQQEPIVNPDISPADSHNSSGGGGSSSSSSSSSSRDGGSDGGSSAQLPLPDVEGYKVSHWDLRYYVEETHIPSALRSQAEYEPFIPSNWLTAAGCPAAAAAAAAVAQQPLPAAAGLAGLWRGTYGMHGVELLQLQLLQAPPGYNMFQQHRLPPEPPTSVDECLPGVLLQSVLQRPGLRLHPGMLDMTAEAETDGESDSSWGTASSEAVSVGVAGEGEGGFDAEQEQEQEQGQGQGQDAMVDMNGNVDDQMSDEGIQDVQEIQGAIAVADGVGYEGGGLAGGGGGATAAAAAAAAAAVALSAAGFDDAAAHSNVQTGAALETQAASLAAAAAAAAAAPGASSSGTQQQQQQQQQGDVLPLPQQLLLVATKVTGDRNVPAGQVTFAVDLATRSTAGAGQLLQIHNWMHSAVEVNGPDTRPLVMKERYSGLAQIAETYFQSPKISPVELLLFEDPSCFGVLWAGPMDTFSFFVRQAGLP